MDAIHQRRPLGHGGKLVSLQDLGYADVGLDGGWARCEGVPGASSKGVPGRTYHDKHGNLLVNETLYPSFLNMTGHAHSLGLTASWYLNCDQCGLDSRNITPSAATEAWYQKDAEQAARFNFDGVKFDTQPGGPNWNISKWSAALNATGKPIVIQDCLDKHPDGTPLPKSSHPKIDILNNPENCPFTYYRTGGDNFPSFLNGMKNSLIDSEPFLNVRSPVPASRPGCWAFPDMLSIGSTNVMRKEFHEKHPDCPLHMSFQEEQTLFATWAIISSPLILSFDVTNDTELARLWPIIANEQALSINSQWAGEAGHVLKRSAKTFMPASCVTKKSFPSWVVWSKQLSDPSGSVAVLAINIADLPQALSVTYDELVEAGAGPSSGNALVGTDVWTGRQVVEVRPGEAWQVSLPNAHGSRFVVFSPVQDTVV